MEEQGLRKAFQRQGDSVGQNNAGVMNKQSIQSQHCRSC